MMQNRVKMNVLSLFDGIGCGAVALERAGHKIEKYYASEIEPLAIKVVKYHYLNSVQITNTEKLLTKTSSLLA